ncbi:hypothetical protein BJX96DRAFT_167299 [Aspergillus floccosus]
MARIIIVGSGIIGMATAALLARRHKVTIIARNLPGDKLSIDWASPWAGAIFVAGDGPEHEQKMQLEAFSTLWQWSIDYPESSLRQITIEGFYEENRTADSIWWRTNCPCLKFRFLSPECMPKGAKTGVSYRTVVLNPTVFLPWLRWKLEGLGVEFKRMYITSLADAHKLVDVADKNIDLVRGQTIIVKSNYDKVFLHDNSKHYTYAIPRLDGTVILGGVRQYGSIDPAVDPGVSQYIVQTLHKNLPDQFSPNLAEYDIVGHNVGIRPGRTPGPRIEKEVKDGRKIVHVYGFSNGGYIYSFGAAHMAVDLVDEHLFPFPSFAPKL